MTLDTSFCRDSQTGGISRSVFSVYCRESFKYTSYPHQLDAGAMASVDGRKDCRDSRISARCHCHLNSTAEPARDLFDGYPTVATPADCWLHSRQSDRCLLGAQ